MSDITDEVVQAAAMEWANAPFPSKASLTKARRALEAAEMVRRAQDRVTWEERNKLRYDEHKNAGHPLEGTEETWWCTVCQTGTSS